MELSLYPKEAAYVRDGEYADQNYRQMGAAENGLELKNAEGGYTRHVLLSFDLTALAGTSFRKVFFQPAYVRVLGTAPMYCDLYRVSDDWASDTVTWNTRPALGEPIYENGPVVSLVEMDITDAVRKTLDGGRTRLSFCMQINCPCIGNTRAALDAEKTALLATDEDRDEHKLLLLEDNPALSAEQIPLLPYIPVSWRPKLQALSEAMKKRFGFVVQTDVHMFDLQNLAQANNVKAMTAFADFNFIVNLGDLIRGYKYEEDNSDNLRACMDELVRRYTEGCHCPVLMTIGNHDRNGVWCRLNESDDLITRAEHFSRVQKPLKAYNGAAMVTNPEDVNGDSIYCYMDFEAFDIRVIVADSTDNGTEFNSFKVSEAQLEWLEKTALQTDKQVIVMTHTPFIPSFPDNGNRVTNGEGVLAAVERFIANGGRFIAYMYGHTHAQHEVQDENGRWHISFINGGANAEAVIVDTDKGTIETLGFGSARDRRIEYR